MKDKNDANMTGVRADEIDLALYIARIPDSAASDASIDGRAFLTANDESGWWRAQSADTIGWLTEQTDLKFCVKCEQAIAVPQFPNEYSERCISCSDDAATDDVVSISTKLDDPDHTLKTALVDATTIIHEEDHGGFGGVEIGQLAHSVADAITALDKHLRAGGKVPHAWREAVVLLGDTEEDDAEAERLLVADASRKIENMANAMYADAADSVERLFEDVQMHRGKVVATYNPDLELHECLRLVTDCLDIYTPRDAEAADALVKRARKALQKTPRECLRCAANVRQGGSLEKAVRDALQGTMDDRCDDGKCPGWSIFNESIGNPEIQRCDDCCPEHVRDGDVAMLREARVALCEAWVRVLDGEGGPLPRLRQRYGFGWKLRVLTHPNECPELALLAATGETLIQDFEPRAIDVFLEGVESVVNHIPRLPGR